MIYVVEIPEIAEPRAWFAFDADDFARKVEAGDPLQPWEIHDVITPRELLALMDRVPEDPAARAEFPAISALGDTHGWDTPLYRADHLIGRGIYQPQVVAETDACVAALRQRNKECCVFWSDEQAIAATEGADALLAQREHWRARYALHEQLVALEVLADGGS
jgi:hypothetical protein